GGRGRNAGRARGVGEGETGRALLRDQHAGGLDQRFLEIAVMVRAFAGAPFPTHVKGVYIKVADRNSERRRSVMRCVAPRPMAGCGPCRLPSNSAPPPGPISTSA